MAESKSPPLHLEYGVTEANTVELKNHDDDNPHNPVNWRLSQKLIIMAVVGIWILLGTTNMTIISPALTIIPAELHSPFDVSTYLVAGPLLAYGVASFVWVPVANRIGARAVYVFGAIGATCFSIWGAKATSFGSLVTARTLAGVMFAPPETLAPQMIGDLWSIKHRATAMTWIGILQATGFAGGPFVGGFVLGNDDLGWRWVQWIMAIVTAGTAVALLFLYPETQYIVDTTDSKRKFTTRTWKDNLRFWPVSGGGKAKSENLTHSFLSLGPMFAHPVLLLSVSFFSIVLVAQTYLMTSQSLAYAIIYRFRVQDVGLTFIATALGVWIAMAFCGVFADWLFFRGQKGGHLPAPERRLPLLAFTGSVGVAGLIVFGTSIQNHTHWVVPLVGSCLMSFCFICSLSISFAYLLDIFRDEMDLLMVVFNGIKNVAAFAIGYAIIPWNTADGYTIPFVVLAMLVLVAHGLVVINYFKGATLRRWATKKFNGRFV